MQGKQRPVYLTAALVVIPLALALVFAFGGVGKGFLGSSLSLPSASSRKQTLWKEALKAYADADYARASELLKDEWPSLLSEEDGCNLVLSVFAENKDFDLAEKAARACLSLGKGVETASEALGFTLSSQGRIPEALKILEGFGEGAPVRLHMTVARLHLMLAQDAEARQAFLRGLKKAEVWSMWVSYALKVPSFNEDKGFVSELLRILASKPQVLPGVEKQVLTLAQNLAVEPGLLELASKRLAAAKSEQE